MLDVDALVHNADWIKKWDPDFPPYKSKQFMEFLETNGISLKKFRKSPLYKNAVRQGLIVDDRWVGRNGESSRDRMAAKPGFNRSQ